MNKFKNWLIGILAGSTLILGVLYFTKEEPKTVKIPVKIEVPIPGKVATFPPVKLPIPKVEKPRPVLDIPDKDKDSVLKDALTERTYEEKFKDSTQEVTVTSNVRGVLLSQQVSYEIYPDTVQVDTSITVDIPNLVKPELLGEVELGVPMEAVMNPVFKAGLHYRTKKKIGYKLSIDTNKYIWGGVSIKF